MMALSVAEDFPIPPPLTLSPWFKALFAVSILNSTIIFSLSLSQLAFASRYIIITSPIAAGLTALHSIGLWIFCFREAQRDPSYAPRRRRRMPTTRRANLFSIVVLQVLWMAVLAILVIAVVTSKATRTHPEGAESRGQWPRGRVMAVVEAGFAGIQGCVTLLIGVRCYLERRLALQGASRAGTSHVTPRPRRTMWFWPC